MMRLVANTSPLLNYISYCHCGSDVLAVQSRSIQIESKENTIHKPLFEGVQQHHHHRLHRQCCVII